MLMGVSPIVLRVHSHRVSFAPGVLGRERRPCQGSFD